MNIQQSLSSVDIARLDAEILLAHVLQKNREWLMTHPQSNITTQQLTTYQQYVQRRSNHEPVAYITGHKEFYGRDFIVTPDVLIPRPATEGLIDLTIDFLETGKQEKREVDTDIIATSIPSHSSHTSHSSPSVIIDLGTGSGCIAVTLALETDKKIIATDISKEALEVAKQNAEKHGVENRIDFREGDLLGPISNLSEPFIIVSNPPYIPESESLMEDVEKFEPHRALFSGPDGSSSVVQIINSAKELQSCRGVVVECRAGQL